MSNKSIDKLAAHASYTPGPYKVGVMRMSKSDWASLAKTDIVTVERGIDVLAAVWTPDGIAEKDQARLFAAAPELLTACKASLEKLKHGYADPKEISQHIALIEAAIARAEGH